MRSLPPFWVGQMNFSVTEDGTWSLKVPKRSKVCFFFFVKFSSLRLGSDDHLFCRRTWPVCELPPRVRQAHVHLPGEDRRGRRVMRRARFTSFNMLASCSTLFVLSSPREPLDYVHRHPVVRRLSCRVSEKPRSRGHRRFIK